MFHKNKKGNCKMSSVLFQDVINPFFSICPPYCYPKCPPSCFQGVVHYVFKISTILFLRFPPSCSPAYCFQDVLHRAPKNIVSKMSSILFSRYPPSCFRHFLPTCFHDILHIVFMVSSILFL